MRQVVADRALGYDQLGSDFPVGQAADVGEDRLLGDMDDPGRQRRLFPGLTAGMPRPSQRS